MAACIRTLIVALISIVGSAPAVAQPYSARRNGEVVGLEDSRSRTAVSIALSVGNIAFEMKVKGANVLWWPYSTVEEFTARPAMSGIPFLGPWANRLDEQAFYANGTRYTFDMALGNVRGAIPIHGFLTTNSQWQLVEAKADASSAWATSRLEFYRQPAWMKQFPFAHTIEMTHRLPGRRARSGHRGARICRRSQCRWRSGFIPYFTLTGTPGATSGRCRSAPALAGFSHRTRFQPARRSRLRSCSRTLEWSGCGTTIWTTSSGI